ncbi:MAG: SpoIID/LytB domain-containing protein [Eubacteriales bacterium]|nr:SpoIID/LytB domain-containing protein [Eubacteriales bacterium]
MPKEEISKEENAGEGTEETVPEKKIRVLLMDTDFQSYFHDSVTVVYHQENCEERITYTPESPELADSPLIVAEKEGGIRITTIERQQGNPLYEGTLEIRNTPDGLLLINELPLESYLESVVPSEMPSSYAREALKAQAVCARTYACRQMQEAVLKDYGADVDDSVRFQVYANIAPQESTTNAVQETAGQVLCQGGELIQAYYFSTSSGATSTDEIWGAEEAASYLKAVDCDFDENEPWSSWRVTIPWQALADRSAGYCPDKESGGALGASSGKLTALEITRKNQSGAVTGLHVITEDGSFQLTEEYSIREFLSPAGCTITEKDGSSVQGSTLLPSAYFTMETVPGESVTLLGRGYGHGVGMSQTAANQMALQGFTYPEILNYFFKDIEINQIEKEDCGLQEK